MDNKLATISLEKEASPARGQKARLKLIIWLFSVLLLAVLGAKFWGA